jgi:hypothetical protein
MTQSNGPTGSWSRSSSQGCSSASPGVHADLAATASLAAPDEQGAASLIEIGLGERQRFLDAQPSSLQDHDQPAQPAAVRVVAGGAHHGDDLLHLRRIARVSAVPCCAVVDRRESQASSPAIDVDPRGRAAART